MVPRVSVNRFAAVSATVSDAPFLLKFGSAASSASCATLTMPLPAMSMAKAVAAVPASSNVSGTAPSTMVRWWVPAVKPEIPCSPMAWTALTVASLFGVTEDAAASPAALAGASRLATLSDTL